MKYFYTEPLAAAWMAKHFKMKFSNITAYCLKNKTKLGDFFPHGEWENISSDLSIGQTEFDMLPPDNFKKIYIHLDSLHLLEPRVGDVIENKMEGTWELEWHQGCFYSIYPPTAEKTNEKPVLIQRDGIPFMWPEKEE